MADVFPLVDDGTRPSKSVVGEEFDITATVYREGHDAVNANVVLTDPAGATTVLPMTCVNPGLDHWTVTVSAPTTGRWSYRVEGWSDPYGTWHHDATIKIAADVDTEVMLEEGARVLERALASVERTPEQAGGAARRHLASCATRPFARKPVGRRCVPRRRAGDGGPTAARPRLRQPRLPVAGGAGAGAVRGVVRVLPAIRGLRFDEATGLWRSGTFATAAERLPAVAEMGFDVIYSPRSTRSAGSTARARTTR